MLAASASTDNPRHLSVLLGHRPPQPNVRYVDQVLGERLSDIDFHFFEGALGRHDVDVVHVHRLESLLGGPKKSSAERLAAATDLVKTLASNRIALVQTLYGPRQGSQEEWCKVIDQATSAFIVLDESTPSPSEQLTTLIPHAHYRDRFLGYPRAEQVRGRILALSRDRLGRTSEAPLKTFGLTDTPGLSLRVVGEADATFADLAARARAKNPDTVTTCLERVSDGAAVMEITAAELVILPGTQSLDDLSMLFLALSLDRPVMVEESETTRLLSEEVGAGWIFQHVGPLTAELLDETVANVRRTPRANSPSFNGRDWDSTAAKYAQVFHQAAAAAKSQRTVVAKSKHEQVAVRQVPKNVLGVASVAGIAFLVGRISRPARNPVAGRLVDVVRGPVTRSSRGGIGK